MIENSPNLMFREDNLVLKYSANEINLGKDSVILNLNDGSGLSLISTSFIKSYVQI